jgi:hypothetical protein
MVKSILRLTTNCITFNNLNKMSITPDQAKDKLLKKIFGDLDDQNTNTTDNASQDDTRTESSSSAT